jgi:RNA recognition motif-containing protein
MTSPGYALVHYSSAIHAKAAVTSLNNSIVKGKAICVRLDRGVTKENVIITEPSAKVAVSREIDERYVILRLSCVNSYILR